MASQPGDPDSASMTKELDQAKSEEHSPVSIMNTEKSNSSGQKESKNSNEQFD